MTAKGHVDRQRPHHEIHEAHDLVTFALRRGLFEPNELEGAEITQRTLCWVMGHEEGGALVATNFDKIRQRIKEDAIENAPE